jgi:nitrite reductase/ring-hydroxylating ferredoxin subunit
MKLVGRVPKKELDGGAMVVLTYPPFDVLVSKVGARYAAIEDACNHAGASLADGGRSGDCVVCPMHGYVFDLKTGTLVQPKGLCDDQRAFVCEVEGDDVVVWDPASLIVINP